MCICICINNLKYNMLSSYSLPFMYIFMDDCLTLENQLMCSGENYFSHFQIFSVAYNSLSRVKASLGSHLSGHNGEILCVWLLMLLEDHNLKATSLYCYFLNYFLMFSLSHSIFLKDLINFWCYALIPFCFVCLLQVSL